MVLLETVFMLIFYPSLVFSAGKATSTTRAVSESRYTKAHSLGRNYLFDPRDGWETVNVTNLAYKYRRDAVDKKTFHSPSPHKSGLGSTISDVLKGVFRGLKGLGKAEPVVITWYQNISLDSSGG